MARQPRNYTSGSRHLVMNRVIARHPLFETTRDIRCFLACPARSVRRGEIEVHVWCVLTMHSQIIVRSPNGELSYVMRHIRNE